MTKESPRPVLTSGSEFSGSIALSWDPLFYAKTYTVQVFAGLTAKVTIAGGLAENVLTLPATAVEGAAGTGVVYLIGSDGESVETPVTLGLSDGITVEITGGVEEGDLVLQFVPGALADPGTDAGFSVEG